MATTTTPYVQFLRTLLTGTHDFLGDQYNVALLTSSYTPDFTAHTTFASVNANEVTGTGYTANGKILSNITVGYTSPYATVTADSVLWSALTVTARYAVIYKNVSNVAANSPLVGLIDFGINRSYTAEDFELSFPNDVVQVGVLP